MVERNCAALAGIFAAVSKAAAAGISDLIARSGTLVTRDVDNLDNVGIILLSAHSNLNALRKYCALLVYAAAHRGSLSRYDYLGDIKHIVKQGIVPRLTCNFS